MTDSDDVALRAARDVARLLDRRGLRELVALARRVRQELDLHPDLPGVLQPGDRDAARCTLRQRDRPAQQRSAARTVDDRDP